MKQSVKFNELMEKARNKAQLLDWNSCITLYNQLESGHPMIDVIFDRMEEIDADRFDKFLDGEE